MKVSELCQLLLDRVGPDAIVALAGEDGVPHHVSRTSPQPYAQGLVAVLDMSPRIVTEEDLA